MKHEYGPLNVGPIERSHAKITKLVLGVASLLLNGSLLKCKGRLYVFHMSAIKREKSVGSLTTQSSIIMAFNRNVNQVAQKRIGRDLSVADGEISS